jgi:hypothetical protein
LPALALIVLGVALFVASVVSSWYWLARASPHRRRRPDGRPLPRRSVIQWDDYEPEAAPYLEKGTQAQAGVGFAGMLALLGYFLR